MTYYPSTPYCFPESSNEYTGNLHTIEDVEKELDNLFNPRHDEYDFICDADRAERECALKARLKELSS
jgi:hypothetical protein